jgi:hypothetical protein
MTTVAMANIFGGGMGMELASTNDPLIAGFIVKATAEGEKIVNKMITDLARAIRFEITDAWNKGQKQSASSE